MEDQPKTGKRNLVLAGIAGVVALILSGFVLLSPSGATDLATVTPLEPTVRLQQEGDQVFKPVTKPVATNQGAKVETDKTGMAEISFFDGSLTRLGPETEYELSTLEDDGDKAIVGDLEIGRTFHRATKLSGSGERFEVRTSNAVAAVRGTAFVVVCLVRDVCTIGVVEGQVEVVSRTTGEKVTLLAGQELTVLADGSLSDVRPLNFDDEWIELNLGLEEIDIEKVQEELFGADRLPATDDDPEPAAAAGGSSAGGAAGPGDDGAAGPPEETPRGPGDDVPPGPGGEGPPGPDGEGPPPCVTGYPPRPC